LLSPLKLYKATAWTSVLTGFGTDLGGGGGVSSTTGAFGLEVGVTVAEGFFGDAVGLSFFISTLYIETPLLRAFCLGTMGLGNSIFVGGVIGGGFETFFGGGTSQES